MDTLAASRQALLERECQGNAELRQEVERLLGTREHLPEWLPGARSRCGPSRRLPGARPSVALKFLPAASEETLSRFRNEVRTARQVYLFLLTMIKIPVQQRWLAASLFIVPPALFLSTGYSGPCFAAVARPALAVAGVATALTRFGLLAAVAAVLAQTTLRSFPLTTNPSAWYAHLTLIGLATVLTLARYSFATTLRGRQMGSALSTP